MEKLASMDKELEDTGINDMLENVKTYGEMQAEEDARRAELKRQEEEKRLQEKEQFAEDSVRLEEEAREAERLATEESDKSRNRLILAFSIIGVAILVAILIFFVFPRKPRRPRRRL